MFYDYSELINDMRVGIRNIDCTGTICIALDKNTELKLYKIFGTENAINVQIRLKEELDKLGLREILSKYRCSLINTQLECDINRDIRQFIQKHHYEIYNKFMLILCSYPIIRSI